VIHISIAKVLDATVRDAGLYDLVALILILVFVGYIFSR
jgi:hypothetical protein